VHCYLDNACPADNNLEHFHIVLRCCDRCKKLMFSVMIIADGVIRVPSESAISTGVSSVVDVIITAVMGLSMTVRAISSSFGFVIIYHCTTGDLMARQGRKREMRNSVDESDVLERNSQETWSC